MVWWQQVEMECVWIENAGYIIRWVYAEGGSEQAWTSQEEKEEMPRANGTDLVKQRRANRLRLDG